MLRLDYYRTEFNAKLIYNYTQFSKSKMDRSYVSSLTMKSYISRESVIETDTPVIRVAESYFILCKQPIFVKCNTIFLKSGEYKMFV